MIFKIIAFVAAAIPVFLLIRSLFFRRSTRINDSFKEFRKHANIAVSVLLCLIALLVAVAAWKLAWAWWTSV